MNKEDVQSLQVSESVPHVMVQAKQQEQYFVETKLPLPGHFHKVSGTCRPAEAVCKGEPTVAQSLRFPREPVWRDPFLCCINAHTNAIHPNAIAILILIIILK